MFHTDGNVSITIDGGAVHMQIKDVLQFISGADCVPPLGFEKKFIICFYDQEKGITRLPFASTCALQLSLPRGAEDESTFTTLMTSAIFGSAGFGKV